jgi:peptidoglycan/LPS O-acetylase OafA/YrhL
MVMGYWRREGMFDRLRRQRVAQVFVVVLLVAIAALLVARGQLHLPVGARSRMLIEVALVFCAYTHENLRRFLSNRFSRFLGSISFPIYLVHFQVLISLMSWLVVVDAQRYGPGNQPHLLVIACVNIVVSVAVACVFREVERVALKASDSVILRLLNDTSGASPNELPIAPTESEVAPANKQTVKME